MRLELVKASPDAGKSSMEIFYDNLSNIRKEWDYTILYYYFWQQTDINRLCGDLMTYVIL